MVALSLHGTCHVGTTRSMSCSMRNGHGHVHKSIIALNEALQAETIFKNPPGINILTLFVLGGSAGP